MDMSDAKNSPHSVHEAFVRAADEWLRQLQARAPRPREDEAGPRHVVNLGHRLSDTLPTDLAERLEGFMDEFWTVCQQAWPDRDDVVSVGDDLMDRLDRIAPAWARLKQDLRSD